MRFRISLLPVLAAVPLLAPIAKAQDVPSDVKPDHWAYAAVEDLAKKGLIKGYPPDGRFLGGRTLTRYEMATILKRVLDRMDDLLKNQQKAGPSQEDFDKLKSSVGEIGQLVQEFKTQLTVIGADLSKVRDDLASLRQQVGELGARVNSFDTRLNTLSTKVDAATVIADRAIQGITELRTALNTGLAKKVDVGVGRLRIGGTMQVWAGTAFGNTFGGNFPSNFSPPAPGRNYGGGVGDTFRLRRAEIALYGNITPVVDFKVMFDPARTGTGSGAPLQDLWVGYQIAPRFRFEIGAQKPGLSEEAIRVPANLLTVERSIMNDLPNNNGRVGNQRDTGAVLRYQGALGNVALGIWNDNGAAQNSLDNDRFKFATFTGFFTGLRYLTLGVWGGTNLGDFRPRNIRDRAGATVLFQYGHHLAEAEFAYAGDRESAPLVNAGVRTRALGGYALYAYALNSRWQFVGRYDEWDPSVHGGSVGGVNIGASRHNMREYTFGLNYYIRGNNAKIQLNYIIEDPQGNGYAFWGTRRQILLSNFQTAF